MTRIVFGVRSLHIDTCEARPGPSTRCWFQLAVAPETLTALRQRSASVARNGEVLERQHGRFGALFTHVRHELGRAQRGHEMLVEKGDRLRAGLAGSLMMYPDGPRLGIDRIAASLENGISRLAEVLNDTDAARRQLLG